MQQNQRKPNIIELLEKVKQQLNSRGPQTIRQIAKVFKAMDSYDGNKKIDATEFQNGMQQLGVKLTKQESDALMSFFDTDRDGHVNLNEFLVGIRGKMNARRQAMVDKAFLKFDRNCNGFIDASDLKGVYNACLHPKVIQGLMTNDQAFLEFLGNFNDRNRDGRIQRDEWNDYYNAVSASIDKDDHFVQLMKSAWKLV
eukprot:403366647